MALILLLRLGLQLARILLIRLVLRLVRVLFLWLWWHFARISRGRVLLPAWFWRWCLWCLFLVRLLVLALVLVQLLVLLKLALVFLRITHLLIARLDRLQGLELRRRSTGPPLIHHLGRRLRVYGGDVVVVVVVRRHGPIDRRRPKHRHG